MNKEFPTVKWLDFQVFSDKDDKPEVPSHSPSMFIILWDVKEPTHLSLRVGHEVPGVVVCMSSVVYHGWKGKKRGHRCSASLTGKVNR